MLRLNVTQNKFLSWLITHNVHITVAQIFITVASLSSIRLVYSF